MGLLKTALDEWGIGGWNAMQASATGMCDCAIGSTCQFEMM